MNNLSYHINRYNSDMTVEQCNIITNTNQPNSFISLFLFPRSYFSLWFYLLSTILILLSYLCFLFASVSHCFFSIYFIYFSLLPSFCLSFISLLAHIFKIYFILIFSSFHHCLPILFNLFLLYFVSLFLC